MVTSAATAATVRYRWPWDLPSVARAAQDDLLGFVHDHFEAKGDRVRFVVGPKSIYRTRSAADAHRILVDDAKQFDKPRSGLGIDPVRTLLGNGGLILLNGDTWRRHRRMVQPSLLRSRIAGYAPIMRQVAEEHVARLTPHTVIDLQQFFGRLTLDLVCRLLFDVPMGQDYDRVRALLDDVQASLARVATQPAWAPTPNNLRYKAAVRRLDRFMFRLIDDRLAQGAAALAGRTDVLSTLCSAADDEDDRTFTRRELRNELVTLFLAGHDTTALALTWAGFELGRRPDVDAALADELGGGDDRTYTRAVLDETLRLYPSAYAVIREANTATTLGPFEVPAGSNVAVWSIFIHRHPAHWPRPLRFDPDRFLPGAALPTAPGAYIPFGAGTRVCIGKHFALMEAAILLEALFAKYRVDTTDVAMPRIVAGPTLSPRGGIPARLLPR